MYIPYFLDPVLLDSLSCLVGAKLSEKGNLTFGTTKGNSASNTISLSEAHSVADGYFFWNGINDNLPPTLDYGPFFSGADVKIPPGKLAEGSSNTGSIGFAQIAQTTAAATLDNGTQGSANVTIRSDCQVGFSATAIPEPHSSLHFSLSFAFLYRRDKK